MLESVDCSLVFLCVLNVDCLLVPFAALHFVSLAECGASSTGGTVPPRHPSNGLSTVKVCYCIWVLDGVGEKEEKRRWLNRLSFVK